MTNKVFNHTNYATKENAAFYYPTPKELPDGEIVSYVTYLEGGEKCKICFETEEFKLSKGVQRTPGGLFYIDIKFGDSNASLREFIGELDELAVGNALEKSVKWFGEQFDWDLLDTYYKYPLRTDSKTGEAFFRIRLNNDLVIKNQFGKDVSLDLVVPESKIKAKIRYDGLAFYNQNFMPIYYVYELEYQQSKKEVVGKGFKFTNSKPLLTSNLGYETEMDMEDNPLEYEDKNEELIKKELGIKESFDKDDVPGDEFSVKVDEVSVKVEEVTRTKEEVVEVVEALENNGEGEITDILSKNLTKAISNYESENSLVIYGNETPEELEEKIRELHRLLKERGEKSVTRDDTSSGKKPILKVIKSNSISQII